MSEGHVTVTDRAVSKVAAILSKEPAGCMLRVSVESGGCTGFQYKYDVERERAEDDLVLGGDKATILIDPVSVEFLAGSEINFVDDLIGAAFKINNPNAKSSCGCGTSFAL